MSWVCAWYGWSRSVPQARICPQGALSYSTASSSSGILSTCPRALDTYVHRAALWRKSDQLFVCNGPYKKGFPANKQTLSRWIVDTITTGYESSDLSSLLRVRAHSTRGMAAPKAFSSGVSMNNISNAAGWSTSLTFVRFYSLDLEATPGSSVLSAWVVLFHTRQGLVRMAAWAVSFAKCPPMQLEFPKGNVPGYICNHGYIHNLGRYS